MYSDQSVPKDDKFILGTDNLGRSLAKRVIVGIRISLLIAIVATLIDLIIGVTYGLVSGFLGGKLISSCNMLLRLSHLSLTWS